MNSAVFKNLFGRKSNIKFSLSSNYYEDKITSLYFDSFNFLYKSQLKSINKFVVPIEFSDDGSYLASGGTEGCVEFWNVNKTLFFNNEPQRFQITDVGCILNLAINKDSTKLFSSTQNFDFFMTDTATGNIISRLDLGNSVNVLSSSPTNANLVVFSEGEEKFKIYDTRESKIQSFTVPFPRDSIQSIVFHPCLEHLFLVTTTNKKSIFTFDIRNCNPLFYYNFLLNDGQNFTFAKYNKKGDRIFASRIKFAPALFDVNYSDPIYEFDNFGFINILDSKKSCFAGSNDEYVVSGSDDCNIYVWKIPNSENPLTSQNKKIPKKVNNAKFILKGHRSSIYQVSYNYQRAIIASSGSDIKLWSPLNFPLKKNFLSSNIDHERHLNYIYKSVFFHGDNNPFIFDNLVEDSRFLTGYDEGLIKFFFDVFRHSSRRYNYNFNYVLKNYQSSIDDLKTDFKEDELFFIIKLFVLDNENTIFKNLELFKLLEEVVENQNKDVLKRLSLKNVSFIIEVRKFYEMWNRISYFIIYLIRQSILIKKTIRNLNIARKIKKEDFIQEKKELLEKMNLIINLMNCCLFKLFLNVRNNYGKLFDTMKFLLTNIDELFVKDIIRYEISVEIKKLITKKDFDYEDNDENNALFNTRIQKNELFDEELNLSLFNLKNKFKKQMKILKKFKKESFFEICLDLDTLFELFCFLN